MVYWMGLLNIGQYLEGLEPWQWIKHFRVLFVVFLAPLLFFGAYFIYYGLMVVKAGEFPLPGSKVIRDTTVQEGRWAIFRGKVLVFLGVCMFLTFAYGAVVIPNMFERMMNEYTPDKESGEHIQIYAGLPGYP